MKTKFVWNGIKVNGKLHRCSYSYGALLHHPEGTITIYAKDYTPLPKINGLTAENNSEYVSDYVVQDLVRVTPDNVHYAAVKDALRLRTEHFDKRHNLNKERGQL
jgi:hypothetical protein